MERPVADISSADWLKRPETQAVFAALAQDGHSARAVGGAVRNTLMGLAAADIDLATTAPPELVIEFARRAGLGSVPTGLKHGTVTVIASHVPFEVTTLREDVRTFGRHAEVAFTQDWAADARRRDFTMNALYCSADGAVHDPLGGLDDLLARRVRFIGSAEDRIREDYLRILRFFRFFAQYGRSRADMDAEGLAASARLAPGLDALSAERIRQELVRLLAASGATMAVEAMHAFGLLTRVLRRAPRPRLMSRLAEIEMTVGETPDPMLRLGVLAVETLEDAEALAGLLRLSGDERATLQTVAAASQRAIDVHGEMPKQLLYRLGVKRYRQTVLTGWSRAGAGADDRRWHALFALPEDWTPPECPVRGRDVVALGVASGPAIGIVLGKAEAAWVASQFTMERGQLLELIKTEVDARNAHGRD